MHVARGAGRIAALVVGLVAISAGCGRKEALPRSEYERAVQEQVASVARGIANLTRERDEVAAGSASLDDALAAAVDLRASARDAAAVVRDLSPPADARAPHDQLSGALAALAREMDGFVQALEHRDVAAVQALAAGAASLGTVRRVDRACERLRSRGYDVEFARADDP